MSEAKTTALAVIPKSIDEITDLAERLSKSTLLPKAMQGKMPDVLVTIMAGGEMGLSPMASLRAIHVIEGKPVLSADGMVAIILGSGKAKYFTRVEESDTAVTYETCRVGTEIPRRATWTMQMAKAAALHLKDNWRAHPRAMLAARAKSELARDVYPDVLMGCYTDDEIGGGTTPTRSTPTPQPSDVIDAEVVSETPSGGEPAALAQIDAATTIEQLNELSPALASLDNGWKKIARERWTARKKGIEAGELPTVGVAV